jgi:rhodanese-related sulfurtransferase
MNISVNTPLDQSIPNTLNITFDDITNTHILALFDYYGICVSAGSACSTPENKPSHVLTAIGLSDEKARKSIRLSLSSETTMRDISKVISVLEKLRDGKTPHLDMISPFSLNKEELFNTENYFLDVRYWYDKLSIKSLPGAHEASLFLFGKYLKHIPHNKKVIVACQSGLYSPLIVFYLKKKGYRNACFILTGMEGWKAAYPDLYDVYAGKDIIKLRR